MTGELFSTHIVYKQKQKEVQKAIKASQDYYCLIQLQMGDHRAKNAAFGYPRKFSLENESRNLWGFSSQSTKFVKIQ